MIEPRLALVLHAQWQWFGSKQWYSMHITLFPQGPPVVGLEPKRVTLTGRGLGRGVSTHTGFRFLISVLLGCRTAVWSRVWLVQGPARSSGHIVD